MKFKGDATKLVKVMDKGVYDDALKSGQPLGVWMEEKISDTEWGGFEPTIYKNMTNYEMFKTRKELKRKGESIPPNAFEIALAAHGIKAYGAQTDPVSKFFLNSGTVILFPFWLSNQIYTGALMASLVPELIANTVVIQGLDYRKIYLSDSEGDRQTARTSRGGEAPTKHFRVTKQDQSLEKYMIELLFDYEVINDTPLNLYSAALQKVGAQIGIDETDDLVYALINGDGNSNGLEAGQTVDVLTSGSIEKLDIIGLSSALPLPYKLRKFVGRKTYMRLFWDALSDMTNPAAQWGMTGMDLPIGYEWDRASVTADTLYGVDPDLGVQFITNDTAVMTETDKIINKQQVRTVVSKRSKISIIDQDAIGALDVTP